MAQASQGRVQLIDPRNSLWAGSAQVVLSGGSGSRDAQALPGRLRWRIQPTWTGMRVLWRAECCMAQTASVTLQFGLSTLQLSLSDHLSQWPAALLSGLGAPWNTLQPEGQLQWRTDGLQLRWSEGRLQMTGQVELQVQQLSEHAPVRGDPEQGYRGHRREESQSVQGKNVRDDPRDGVQVQEVFLSQEILRVLPGRRSLRAKMQVRQL